MKTLVIGRHAKSDWSLGLPDFERPLNQRGERDAPQMGRLLTQYGFRPDLIISSPANRAKTTAELIARELGYTDPVRTDQRIYDEGHGTITGLIQEFDDRHDTVMLFGHNPTLENLVTYLLQMQGDIVMPTCSMLCLEVSSNSWKGIKPVNTNIKWFLIPKIVNHLT